MMKRISAQRHGQSEPLSKSNQKSSFTAINDISGGAADIVSDPIAAGANTFAGPGRFGKMFPESAPFRPADDELIALAQAMLEAAGDDDAAANHPSLPAGFTYLGQFIDHDITFDKTVGLPQIDDPALIEQARTPNLDLDSVYGFGPGSEADGAVFAGAPGSEVFILGSTSFGTIGGIEAGFPNDLPRTPDERGREIVDVPDKRNDENLIIAQTHLAFLKFHNKLIAVLPPSASGEPSLFERAKKLVTWHYQWIVLNDFLRRLVRADVLDDVLDNGRKFYLFEEVNNATPFMPLEFSVAAYRFGHTLIRAVYDYNRVFKDTGNPRGTLELLFRFTGSGGGAPVPSDWIIDWRRFYEVGDFGGVGGFDGTINRTRKFDTKLADPLKELMIRGQVDEPPPSLAERNLLRGSRLGLPSGQEIARLMNITDPLTDKEIASGSIEEIIVQHGFDQQTPLWFYLLKEAEVRENGERLGETGSRILAEVFVGLLQGDPDSFLSNDWNPALDNTVPKQNENTFTMADMLLFVNDISPIDGLREV